MQGQKEKAKQIVKSSNAKNNVKPNRPLESVQTVKPITRFTTDGKPK